MRDAADRSRLADVLAGMSMVADLGYGMAPGDSMRACILGTTLAAEAGLPDSEVREAYYTSLLRHLGCVGFAHDMTGILGDDIGVNAAGARVNFAKPQEVLTTFLPAVTRGRPLREKARIVRTMAARKDAIDTAYETTSCEVGMTTARRVGLGGGVQRSLYEAFEWWDGRGNPNGVGGEDIAAGARIARVASDAVLFDRIGGPSLAVRALSDRSGTIMDPAIVELFSRSADEMLAGAREGDPRKRVLDLEPGPPAELTALGEAAEAFADLGDVKAPFLHGHSREVARLAGLAASTLGLDDDGQELARMAGHLHDLGRVGVSNRVWEKPGPLTSVEWEEVRLHSYHSERILAGSTALGAVARVVGSHHERLDGSGYHRASAARDITLEARILAAADAFAAMTADRPHRAALAPERAADELVREAEAGRLDSDVVVALLEVAGHPRNRPTTANPWDLTAREVEVLALVAGGLSNAEVGDRLGISRRTAEHHVQHVYAKVGVSSRAAAALLALEHGLVTDRGPR